VWNRRVSFVRCLLQKLKKIALPHNTRIITYVTDPKNREIKALNTLAKPLQFN